MLWRRVLSLIYPYQCILCNTDLPLSSSDPVCSSCKEKIIFLDKETVCKICGRPLSSGVCEECEQGKNHFDLLRSVALYEGQWREIIHHYKYKGKFYLSKFSEELTISTKPSTKIKLLAATKRSGIFEVSKYITAEKKWLSASFFVELGEPVGEVKSMNDLQVDFRTGFALVKVEAVLKKSKTLEPMLLKDSTSGNDIELLLPTRTANKVVSRATLVRGGNFL